MFSHFFYFDWITDNTSIYQYNITIITHEEWKSVLRVGVEMNRIWIRLSKERGKLANHQQGIGRKKQNLMGIYMKTE